LLAFKKLIFAQKAITFIPLSKTPHI